MSEEVTSHLAPPKVSASRWPAPVASSPLWLQPPPRLRLLHHLSWAASDDTRTQHNHNKPGAGDKTCSRRYLAFFKWFNSCLSVQKIYLWWVYLAWVLKVPANTTCKVHALTFKLRLNFTLLIIDRGQLEILQYLYWGNLSRLDANWWKYCEEISNDMSFSGSGAEELRSMTVRPPGLQTHTWVSPESSISKVRFLVILHRHLPMPRRVLLERCKL